MQKTVIFATEVLPPARRECSRALEVMEEFPESVGMEDLAEFRFGKKFAHFVRASRHNAQGERARSVFAAARQHACVEFATVRHSRVNVAVVFSVR